MLKLADNIGADLPSSESSMSLANWGWAGLTVIWRDVITMSELPSAPQSNISPRVRAPFGRTFLVSTRVYDSRLASRLSRSTSTIKTLSPPSLGLRLCRTQSHVDSYLRANSIIALGGRDSGGMGKSETGGDILTIGCVGAQTACGEDR